MLELLCAELLCASTACLRGVRATGPRLNSRRGSEATRRGWRCADQRSRRALKRVWESGAKPTQKYAGKVESKTEKKPRERRQHPRPVDMCETRFPRLSAHLRPVRAALVPNGCTNEKSRECTVRAKAGRQLWPGPRTGWRRADSCIVSLISVKCRASEKESERTRHVTTCSSLPCSTEKQRRASRDRPERAR